MEPDIAQLERHYRSLTNDELVLLFTKNSQGLREEARQILGNELTRRGIRFSSGSKSEKVSKERVLGIARILQALPCPICKVRSKGLNAVRFEEVNSMLLVSNYRSGTAIGCTDCLTTELNRISSRTRLTGWWYLGIFGMFSDKKGIGGSINALAQNKNMRNRIAASRKPTKPLLKWVFDNIEQLELYQQDKEELLQLVGDQNSRMGIHPAN